MTTLSVVDTETTGDGPQDQVCELGVVTVENGDYFKPHAVRHRWSSLIRPTVPVTVQARAVHHITDAALAESWSMAELLERRGLPELGVPAGGTLDGAQDHELEELRAAGRAIMDADIVVVAHNLEFDLRMIDQTPQGDKMGVPWSMVLPARRICTWRCAMHLCQDAPSHKLQVLRYHLGLDENLIALRGVPHVPHRALFDANVCAALLLHFLSFNTVEHLERLTTEPVLLQTVRFGEHEGRAWSQVPLSYLNWIVRGGPARPRVPGQRKMGWDPDTLHTARFHVARYLGNPPPGSGGGA